MPAPQTSPTDTSQRLDELVAIADPSSDDDPAASEAAARELRDLAVRAGDRELAATAQVWACIHLLQQGRLHEAVTESQLVRTRLRTEARSPRVDAVRMELLRTTALAASEIGDFAAAMDAAQELAADPAVLADAAAALDAAFSLAVCLERMGDSWQAMRILNGAVSRHGDAAPSFALLYSLNGLAATAIGAFHRTYDEPGTDGAELLTAARTAAERALALLDEFGNPVYRVAVVGNFGEVLAHQGELLEARRHLDEAMSLAEHVGAAAHRDRVRASIGAWLVLAGRHDEALAWLERLVTDLGPDGPHSTRIRAHHAAFRAARALGRFEVALAHHEAYERLERHRTTSQLRSQSELFVTRSEAQAVADLHRTTAERDALTGLGNRRRLSRSLRALLPEAAVGRPMAIAMIDVDHFKSINDELGHACGDAVLIELAGILGDATGDDDVVARYGGEEILVVMPDVSLEEAAVRCERLRERVEHHVWPELPADRRVTISIGVAAAPPFESELLVSAADRAMYAAKRAGRNLVRVASEDDGRDLTPVGLPRLLATSPPH